eukprot:CAMPEP_0180161380 /NCGR_PEP_ID=MMETSP0986-20121125/28635_1 /TAXON_ID=697907 /ORGANISM="non described non described, Strain CCMP2293" /LENGTH=66 /DNA_ID=CAMNT_0022111745 /DNA_START=657 /DNA_END=853 /DNA_ORIENTATION=+
MCLCSSRPSDVEHGSRAAPPPLTRSPPQHSTTTCPRCEVASDWYENESPCRSAAGPSAELWVAESA